MASMLDAGGWVASLYLTVTRLLITLILSKGLVTKKNGSDE